MAEARDRQLWRHTSHQLSFIGCIIRLICGEKADCTPAQFDPYAKGGKKEPDIKLTGKEAVRHVAKSFNGRTFLSGPVDG